MHYLIDLSIDLSISTSGAVTFFCTQAIGVLLEDFACSVYRSVEGISRDQPVTRGQRIIGYLWVGTFMAWSLPVYVYPMLYRGNLGLDDSVTPYSIVRTLKSLSMRVH